MDGEVRGKWVFWAFITFFVLLAAGIVRGSGFQRECGSVFVSTTPQQHMQLSGLGDKSWLIPLLFCSREFPPIPRSASSTIMRDYVATGGYAAFRKAQSMAPGDVVKLVQESGLRGRGGAGFPCGVKWTVPAQRPASTIPGGEF